MRQAPGRTGSRPPRPPRARPSPRLRRGRAPGAPGEPARWPHSSPQDKAQQLRFSARSPRGVAFGRRNRRGATLVARSYLYLFSNEGGRPSPFHLKLATSCCLVPKWARPLPPVLHPGCSLPWKSQRGGPSARPRRTAASRRTAHRRRRGGGWVRSLSPPAPQPPTYSPGAVWTFLSFSLFFSL